MCGIVATFDTKDLSDKLLNSLKKLEYRGYDSSGVAILESKGKLRVIKSLGKISELEDIMSKKSQTQSTSGIAHTRWATHGVPSDINAHPHFNSDKTIAVVHNGIVENHKKIRSFLESRGYKFVSQTDTEVLPQLFDYEYKKSKSKKLQDVMKSFLAKLDGSYAISIISSLFPDNIVVARKGSPLCLTVIDGKTWAISDPIALLDKTKDYCFLNDCDYAVLSESSYKVYDKNARNVNRKTVTVKSSAEEIGKEGNPHFMLKEIKEQVKYLENFKLNEILEIKRPSKINILACGTSYHAGLLAKYYFEDISKIECNVETASEFLYRNPVISKDSLYIFISQSGETADALSAIKMVKTKNRNTLAITNVVGSSLSRESKEVVYINAGIEIGVASTKTFLGQICVLLKLSLNWSKDKLKKEQILKDFKSTPKGVNEIILKSKEIITIASEISKSKSILFMGRGLSYVLALEGALKLKELSYMHAEGHSAGEMKHGPIALIEKDYPVIFLSPFDMVFSKSSSNIQEILARNGKIFAVTSKGADLPKTHSIFTYARTSDYLYPIYSAVFVQLLAYYTALKKDANIDQPRNLAKSVTVE